MTDLKDDNSDNSSMRVRRTKIPSTANESEEKISDEKYKQKAKPQRTKISSNEDDVANDPGEKSIYFDPNEEAKSKLRAYFFIYFRYWHWVHSLPASSVYGRVRVLRSLSSHS